MVDFEIFWLTAFLKLDMKTDPPYCRDSGYCVITDNVMQCAVSQLLYVKPG